MDSSTNDRWWSFCEGSVNSDWCHVAPTHIYGRSVTSHHKRSTPANGCANDRAQSHLAVCLGVCVVGFKINAGFVRKSTMDNGSAFGRAFRFSSRCLCMFGHTNEMIFLSELFSDFEKIKDPILKIHLIAIFHLPINGLPALKPWANLPLQRARHRPQSQRPLVGLQPRRKLLKQQESRKKPLPHPTRLFSTMAEMPFGMVGHRTLPHAPCPI